ncbi:MAG TPA: cupin domain-containing protein [Myxococcaceae bacterium]|nr:cupin domain-containing protein [Myxococcaceae bacterium]
MLKPTRSPILAAVLLAGFGLAYAKGRADGAPSAMTVDELPWKPVMPGNPNGPQRAILWGDPATGPAGTMLRFPAGFHAGMHSHNVDYHAVVISGSPRHFAQAENPKDAKKLGPGSFWTQKGKEVHDDSCDPGAECILMITTTGPASYIPAGGPTDGGYRGVAPSKP